MARNTYVTLDSGQRQEFSSGMHRDAQEGKPRYDLIPLWFLREVAELMSRGAEKYGDRNWELANSAEEIARFDGSGLRHHIQYLQGERTEDHLAATVFNLFAAEQTRRKIEDFNQVKADTRPIVFKGDPEPDRSKTYQDIDGDYWCCAGQTWYWAAGTVRVTLPLVTGRRSRTSARTPKAADGPSPGHRWMTDVAIQQDSAASA